MAFASSIWLLGLLPWAGVVGYLFRGRGELAVVPFLKLWPQTMGIARRGARRPPAVWVWMVCGACLLAILAAAGPMWMSGVSLGEISIVIDRGITMSGEARYRGLLAKCDAMLGSHIGVVTIVPVPGSSLVVADGAWMAAAAAVPPTAMDNGAALGAAVDDRLRTTHGLVIVLSDQVIDRSDPRMIQVVPDSPMQDVGIASLSARNVPRPQVMVRLVNHSSRRIVHLRVRSGSVTIERDVPLSGEFVTEFVDVPTLGETVTASIDAGDDLPVDDTAWLARQSNGIVLDVGGAVPPEVGRMAAVFMRDRPVGSDHRHVLISDQPIPPEQEGVQIVMANHAAEVSRLDVSISAHALSQGVMAWPGLAADAKPPAGFDEIISRGNVPIVAVHEQSPRQVWVNLDLSGWSRTTDFVVFFSNVFNWMKGDGDDGFTAMRPMALGPGWKKVDGGFAPAGVESGLWPGLYRSVDDRILAVNAVVPVAHERALATENSKSKTAAEIRSGKSLSADACEAALVCVAAGLVLRDWGWALRNTIR